MNIVLKPLEKKHLEEATELYNYFVTNTTVTFHTEVFTPEEMATLLFQEESDIYTTLAVLDNEDFCGYAFLAPYKKRQAYRITAEISIYLKPEYTGKGIGKIVLEKMEQHAINNGIHSLIATICGENVASIKLFERNGYIICGALKEVGIKFGRSLDIVIMQKILDNKHD